MGAVCVVWMLCVQYGCCVVLGYVYIATFHNCGHSLVVFDLKVIAMSINDLTSSRTSENFANLARIPLYSP